MSQKYPYDEKEKEVKEAILEIYSKYILKDDRAELVFEERLGVSEKYPPNVKCDLYQSTYRTYFYSENDAKERKNEVPMSFLNAMQRKPINNIDKISLLTDFGRIHRIVRTKFSPEKLTKMIEDILHERRGEFTGKKTGILENLTKENTASKIPNLENHQIVNWLLNEHDIWIEVRHIKAFNANRFHLIIWKYGIEDYFTIHDPNSRGGYKVFDTPEEAYTEAFKFIEKNNFFKGTLAAKSTGIIEKNDYMKIVKNFKEFLNESTHEKCSVCGKAVEDKTSYADICLSCEEKGYWEDPAGGVHSPDDDDPAAMYESVESVISDSYSDFNRSLKKNKPALAKQIARTASGFIKNGHTVLEDWKKQFKHEELVMKELEKLK